ncbi:protein STRUBBELIG-RECEPTOR FAMILY 1-like [Castanea sativa]|uniref:protein STRUBBELIG-RECEPTOR FAMILY 1-like n=1 Tax=Castanea sativa TaxID=21020 RepID=UPI003F64FEA6
MNLWVVIFQAIKSSISKLRHANIVELMGYCAEHGQRLLVYEYCRNGTLHDALHDDEIQKNLSWKTRIQAALEAARALDITDGQVKIVENELSKSLLENNKCYLLDCGAEVFVWIGRVTQVEERKAAIQVAEIAEYVFGMLLMVA